MALAVGSRLGHYSVTALIGEGGMGQEYGSCLEGSSSHSRIFEWGFAWFVIPFLSSVSIASHFRRASRLIDSVVTTAAPRDREEVTARAWGEVRFGRRSVRLPALCLRDERQESPGVVDQDLADCLLGNAGEPELGDELHQHRRPAVPVVPLELAFLALVG